MANPPRPTAARVRGIRSRLDKTIIELDKMLIGNTHSSDSLKLEKLREVRKSLVFVRDFVDKV